MAAMSLVFGLDRSKTLQDLERGRTNDVLRDLSLEATSTWECGWIPLIDAPLVVRNDHPVPSSVSVAEAGSVWMRYVISNASAAFFLHELF